MTQISAIPLGTPESDSDAFVAGSFRDRSGRVFQFDGQIFRALSGKAVDEWDFASGLQFVRQAMANGELISTTVESRPEIAKVAGPEWAGVLRHERVELLTFPYEWCFSMLRDAALLQLNLMKQALTEDATFKDATPFNVQFRGVQPVFIDTASIVRLKQGGLWEGYRQFCQMFLYPLMLQAYRGVDFQPFLRGRLDGITPEQFNALTSFRDLFRKGVMTHVLLHSKLQTKSEPGRSGDRIDHSLKESGFQKSLIENNIAGLLKLVQGLNWKAAKSYWSNYDAESEPVRLDAEAKEQFVREVTSTQRWQQVWDIGCNLGRYSRIAAEHADLVVALDSDHLTVDRLYRALRDEGATRITPLVYNPADPSPNLGWRCEERSRFADRGQPDLILCLAVIHHLVFSSNLLLHDVIAWLAEQNSALVIEYVDRADPQVQSLLAHREDVFCDYSREAFERCIEQHFRVVRKLDLPSGTRTVFFVVPA